MAKQRRLSADALPLPFETGKPNPEPYLLAGQSLLEQAKSLGLLSDRMYGSAQPGSLPFSSIYCVGDNPCAGWGE